VTRVVLPDKVCSELESLRFRQMIEILERTLEQAPEQRTAA
jgi:hypothetical protein